MELGGSLGREAATGRGVIMIAKAACDAYGRSFKGARIAIQGFGNVGSFTAERAQAEGAKVIAVSDLKGGICSPRGLNVAKLREHARAAGSVLGFKGATEISNAELLALKCDILIPAALGGAVTKFNVDQVKARMIVEAANSPVTTTAGDALLARNIPVIPDILANAGGVTVSYFEWVQNLQQFRWSEDEVNQRMERILMKAFKQVWDNTRKTKLRMRTAAYELAIRKVLQATEFRGIRGNDVRR